MRCPKRISLQYSRKVCLETRRWYKALLPTSGNHWVVHCTVQGMAANTITMQCQGCISNVNWSITQKLEMSILVELIFPKNLFEGNKTKAVLLTSAPQRPQATTGQQHGTAEAKTRLPTAVFLTSALLLRATSWHPGNHWIVNTSGSCV